MKFGSPSTSKQLQWMQWHINKTFKDHIYQLTNSKHFHHFITDLAQAACNGHAAAVLNSFAETVKPDNNEKEIEKNTKKSDEIKTMFPTARWNLKGEVNKS